MFVLSSCGGEKEDPLNVIGSWKLANLETKAVSLGGQQVDVYMTFNDDFSFELYQKIGSAGRYKHYHGTWTLTGTVLDGRYSDNTPWASSYEVTQNKEKTTLVLTCAGEVYTYSKTNIPSDIQVQ